MAQYLIGTVDVTNGALFITGHDTLWLANVSVGDLFKVRGVKGIYLIDTVDSDTQVTLGAAWAGASLTYQEYEIHKDFTPNYDYPEINTSDKEWYEFMTKAIRMVDEDLLVLNLRVETKGTTTTTTTSTSSSTSSTVSTTTSTTSTTTTTSTTSTTTTTSSSTSSTISTTSTSSTSSTSSTISTTSSTTSSTLSTTSTTTTTGPP